MVGWMDVKWIKERNGWMKIYHMDASNTPTMNKK